MILELPNEILPTIGYGLGYNDALRLTSTCWALHDKAKLFFFEDQKKYSELFSRLVRHEQMLPIMKKLAELQRYTKKSLTLDLKVMKMWPKLPIAIDRLQRFFSHLALDLSGSSLDDTSLQEIVANCPKLISLNITNCKEITLLGMLEAHLAPTIQKITGLTTLTKEVPPLAISIASRGTVPWTITSLFLSGYGHLHEEYEEEHSVGRKYMKQVLEVAPQFVDAMVVLGTSQLQTDDEEEDGKKNLEKALQIDPTNTKASEALCSYHLGNYYVANI